MGSEDASDPAGDAPAPPAMSMPQLAVAGGVSGLVARFATHPFDTLKTQMQVAGAVGGGEVPSSARGGPASTSAASPSARYRGALETARVLARTEGPLGFYRGFGAVVAGIPFASAAYFGGYEAAKRATSAFQDVVSRASDDATKKDVSSPSFASSVVSSLTTPTASYVLSGILAQSLASIAYTPIDVVKERMQASGVLGARGAGAYENVVHAFRTIVKTEGVRGGVFRGYWASNFTWWPFSVVYFVVYEHMRDAAVESGVSNAPSAAHSRHDVGGTSERKKKEKTDETNEKDKDALPPWVSGFCGFAAASAATVATHPLDLAKTRLQTLRAVPGSIPSRASSSVFSIARDVARNEGFKRLFAGCGARVAAVAPGSAISFFAYETIKEWMQS